jgi:hypothetical protein
MNNVLGSPSGTAPREPADEAAEALQLAVAPPFWPSQLQCHGPLPLTAVADPFVHRLPVGALASDSPLDNPHTPLTGVVTAKDAAVLSQ